MESTFSPEQNQPRNNSAANSNTAGETTEVTSSSINPTASYVNTYETAITAASQWWSCPGAMANNVKNVPLPDKVFARGEKPEGKVTDARPKGIMSAYAFFVQTFHDENKKEPDETLAEYSKKCSKRWNAMNEKEKKKFYEMAEQV